MQFFENELFHIYNRGNNRQRIFFSPENYSFFLRKVRKYILPWCDILSWSLMPNHFHFLIHADQRTIQTKRIGNCHRNVLSEGFKTLLSSYAQAINNQNKTTGSLFQQNTNAKQISAGSNLYGKTCFHYIHQNAMKANLVKKMEDWNYCSFQDYCGLSSETLINKELAVQLLDLNMATFYNDSYQFIDHDQLSNIF